MEERLILAHSFGIFNLLLYMVDYMLVLGPWRGSTPWQESVTEEAAHFIVPQKTEEEKGLELHCPFLGNTPNDIRLGPPLKVSSTS